jgi:hypothetical protein
MPALLIVLAIPIVLMVGIFMTVLVYAGLSIVFNAVRSVWRMWMPEDQDGTATVRLPNVDGIYNVTVTGGIADTHTAYAYRVVGDTIRVTAPTVVVEPTLDELIARSKCKLIKGQRLRALVTQNGGRWTDRQYEAISEGKLYEFNGYTASFGSLYVCIVDNAGRDYWFEDSSLGTQFEIYKPIQRKLPAWF